MDRHQVLQPMLTSSVTRLPLHTSPQASNDLLRVNMAHFENTHSKGEAIEG